MPVTVPGVLVPCVRVCCPAAWLWHDRAARRHARHSVARGHPDRVPVQQDGQFAAQQWPAHAADIWQAPLPELPSGGVQHEPFSLPHAGLLPDTAAVVKLVLQLDTDTACDRGRFAGCLDDDKVTSTEVLLPNPPPTPSF